MVSAVQSSAASERICQLANGHELFRDKRRMTLVGRRVTSSLSVRTRFASSTTNLAATKAALKIKKRLASWHDGCLVNGRPSLQSYERAGSLIEWNVTPIPADRLGRLP